MKEMNYVAPSHRPADSISAESQAPGRVCVSAGLINIPPTHRRAHTHTPKGASVMVMAKGCRCLCDGVLLVLALGTSQPPEPGWRARAWRGPPGAAAGDTGPGRAGPEQLLTQNLLHWFCSSKG